MPPETYLDCVTFKIIMVPKKRAHGEVTAECNEVRIKVAIISIRFDRRTHNEAMHY